MAKTPSNPNDPVRPGTPPETPAPKPRPGSLGESEWLSLIPDLPQPEAGKLPVLPSDADLDLESIFAGATVTPSRVGLPHPNATAPPPIGPASGWLTPAPRATPAAPSEDGEGSDIFSTGRSKSRGGSDAAREHSSHDATGHSNIFDSPSAELDQLLGGSVDLNFSGPGGSRSGDASNSQATGLSDDDMFVAFDQPPSELFAAGDALAGPPDDGANAVNDLMDELHLPFTKPGGPNYPRPYPGTGPIAPNSGLDFNEAETDASSSNLFADPTERNAFAMNSGVDLLNPDGDAVGFSPHPNAADGSDSSIFHKRTQGSSLVNMDQIPLVGPGDGPTEAMRYAGPDVDGSSSIFHRDTHPDPRGDFGSGADSGDQSGVSFGSPPRHGKIVSLSTDKPGAVSDDASAAIDWALPGELPLPGPGGKGRDADDSGDSDADLTGRDDGEDVHTTARMAPSSGIFDVDMSREMPLGTLSGSYPAGTAQGSKSGFLTPPKTASSPPRSAVHRPRPATPPTKSTTKVAAVAAPVRKSRGGLPWLGGTAVGLMAGVGVCSALYVAEVIPSNSTTGNPIVRTSPAGSPAVAPAATATDLVDARKLLAAGQAELALPAFEAAGDNASPIDLAGRGLARWQVRVREMGRTGKKVEVGDKYLQPALADLERTVAAADQFKTPDERRAVHQAVLGIGVTKELTGDLAGAGAYYAAAAVKYPQAKGLFESAATRVKLMRAGGKVALAPRDAAGLAEALVIAVTLLQTDGPAAAAGTDEPGLLFWDAANRAAAGDYPGAIAAIRKARTVHESRRLASTGRGVNPLTDPVEQIFLKCCDELAAGWTLRQQLYTDPVAGPVFAESGVATGLRALAAAAKPDPKVAEQLAAAQAALKAKETALAAATAKEVDLGDKLTAATTDAAANAKAAKQKLAAAEADLTAANDAVAKVVGGLKAGKMVGPDADAATVLKTLPEILKKVASASGSADAKKAAEAVAAANGQRDAALVASKQADDKVKALTARMDATKGETQKKLDAAKVEAEHLRTTVAVERKKAADAATLTAKVELGEQKAAYEAKLDAVTRDAKRQAEDARVQMANARAGVAVPLMTTESIAQGQASGLYTRAIDLYFTGRYADAEAVLTRVTQQDPADARYWYFLGLSRLAQEKPGAPEAFQKGAEQEARSLPPARELNAALEKVQGNARRTLNGFRP
jgi:hypothetical protein